MSERGAESKLDLAELLIADIDRRSLRQKLQDFERGDSVRVVSEERDVLARVEGTRETESVDYTERVVEVPIKVYGDSPADHWRSVISWWEPGPVILGDEEERVERLEVK